MNSENVLKIFKEITTIPRESGHEEKIVAWLEEFAEKHSLAHKKDEAGNVLIVKEACPGYEKLPTIVLQSHSDMVCEKIPNSNHDFAKDPIKYCVEDGWLIAKETTLGADCGIGMACALDLLLPESRTGRLEALFTVSEETGLDGAKALKPGFFTGKILINLDNEDEGDICVGCAGGIDTEALFSYSESPVKSCSKILELKVDGCLGGHSGDDINRGHANAVQLLAELLFELNDTSYSLISMEGGNKPNAIARNAAAIIAVDPQQSTIIAEKVNAFNNCCKEIYGNVEHDLNVTVSDFTGESPVFAIDDITSAKLVSALCACPHGVLSMSQEIDDFVETSTNLAAVKMNSDNRIQVITSQRSCINAARKAAARKIEALFVLAGAEVEHNSEYPGWAPAAKSPLCDSCVSTYVRLFGNRPVVRAIHAGLECGLFTEVDSELDMISIGPTMRGVHAPGEKLDLKSLDKFVILLDELVKNVE